MPLNTGGAFLALEAGEQYNTVSFTKDVYAIVALYQLTGSAPDKLVVARVERIRRIPFSFLLTGLAVPEGSSLLCRGIRHKSFYALGVSVYTGGKNVVIPIGAGKSFGIRDFVTVSITLPKGAKRQPKRSSKSFVDTAMDTALPGPTAGVNVQLTQLMAPSQANPIPPPP